MHTAREKLQKVATFILFIVVIGLVYDYFGVFPSWLQTFIYIVLGIIVLGPIIIGVFLAAIMWLVREKR